MTKSAYESRLEEEKAKHGEEVNPMGIEVDDIISVNGRVGIYVASWVNNEQGYLVPRPIHEPITPDMDDQIPIRKCNLISKGEGSRGQLSLPFVTEYIEQAITERNAELALARESYVKKIAQGRRSTGESSKSKPKSNKELEELLTKALAKFSAEELKKILK